MAEPESGLGASALPLVLLHGVGQGPTAWQPVVDVIGTSRRIMAPWLQGMRPGRIESFDVAAAASAVVRQIQLGGHPRVALVGLSLGATVAARVAATEPELVDRLLLAAPILSPPRWLLGLQRSLVSVTPRRIFIRQGVTKDGVRSALAAVGTADLQPDLAALARLGLSPLVVVGAADRVGRAASGEIRRLDPKAGARVVDGAANDLLRDAGTQFGRVIADWLAG